MRICAIYAFGLLIWTAINVLRLFGKVSLVQILVFSVLVLILIWLVAILFEILVLVVIIMILFMLLILMYAKLVHPKGGSYPRSVRAWGYLNSRPRLPLASPMCWLPNIVLYLLSNGLWHMLQIPGKLEISSIRPLKHRPPCLSLKLAPNRNPGAATP